MKIAFIGWGSLINNSRGLRITGEWQKDGPLLPVEYARISNNKSLTLVLYSKASDVQTLWVCTEYEKLSDAIQALKKRERTTEANIGFFSRQDNSRRCNAVPSILPRIIDWTKEKHLDATIWTDLSSNFKEGVKAELTEENALHYLTDLTSQERQRAEKYVLNTPEQIDTKIRRFLKAELGWRSLTEYKNGFWLNKNTFIKADDIEIMTARRKALGNPYGKTEDASMLVLTNAVEMIVDKNGKILGLEKRQKLGLWLDHVNKILKEQD
jgi:hypothetical protein